MPDCCIGVDVIVGFPGETDEEFLDSYNFLLNLDISYLHVFTYSERANTHAITLDEIVPDSVRAIRSKQLHSLSDKKKRAFYESQLGKTTEVLWEAERNGDFMYGFSSNYVKLKTPYQADKVNKICTVTIDQIDTDGICICSEIDSANSKYSNPTLCIQQ